MPDKQQTFGQFDTPADVADLLLAFCLRGPQERVLDPSCGQGALLQRVAGWQRWFSAEPADFQERLWGVELDAAAAAVARRTLPRAHIRHHNFFTLPPPAEPFDALVGNPPYTRAEWIARLHEETGEQLAIFDPVELTGRPDKKKVVPDRLWHQRIGGRAGLHTYFFIHGLEFLREGGRFGFVVPNNWLDVAYGEGLKQFLLAHFRLVALIEPESERWFSEASVNTSLVVLEKCSDPAGRQANQVRFIQLRRPLADLLPRPDVRSERYARLERWVPRLLPGGDRITPAARVRVVAQRQLRAGEKWGLLWRAPAVYRRVRAQAVEKKLVPLKTWATVRRGFTTGANHFFYLDPQTVEEWEIEPRFRRPLLKSLRGIDRLRVRRRSCSQEVFAVPPTASIAGTAAAAYVAWGERQELHRRRTCAARRPWYMLPWQEPAPLVVPKGIWQRHLAPILVNDLLVDQQLYQIQLAPGIAPPVAAALLNNSWVALQMELHGRVNFGEGVLWLAGYEVENLLLPDPRYLTLTQTDRLAELFAELAREPLAPDLETEVSRPQRQALDAYLFSLIGLSEEAGAAVVDGLQARVAARHARARSDRPILTS